MVSSDTFTIPSSEYIEPRYNFKEGKTEYQKEPVFRSQFATGFLLDISKNDVNFRAKGLFGIGDYEIFNRENKKYETKWKCVYNLNLKLIENNLGIKLGGEIRGSIKSGLKPEYTLYIAKQFSLSKLASFIKSS